MSDRESRNDDNRFDAHRTWTRMFADALRGVRTAVTREVNFAVHFMALAAVVAVASQLDLTLERWCLLILSAGMVLAAEFGNTAIEHLARAVTREENAEVRDALNVASGAVLVAAIVAAIVGITILTGPLLESFES